MDYHPIVQDDRVPRRKSAALLCCILKSAITFDRNAAMEFWKHLCAQPSEISHLALFPTTHFRGGPFWFFWHLQCLQAWLHGVVLQNGPSSALRTTLVLFIHSHWEDDSHLLCPPSKTKHGIFCCSPYLWVKNIKSAALLCCRCSKCHNLCTVQDFNLKIDRQAQPTGAYCLALLLPIEF